MGSIGRAAFTPSACHEPRPCPSPSPASYRPWLGTLHGSQRIPQRCPLSLCQGCTGLVAGGDLMSPGMASSPSAVHWEPALLPLQDPDSSPGGSSSDFFPQPLISWTSDPTVIICRHTSRMQLSACEHCISLSALNWQRWLWKCQCSYATRPRCPGPHPSGLGQCGSWHGRDAESPWLIPTRQVRRYFGLPFERCKRFPKCKARHPPAHRSSREQSLPQHTGDERGVFSAGWAQQVLGGKLGLSLTWDVI